MISNATILMFWIIIIMVAICAVVYWLIMRFSENKPHVHDVDLSKRFPRAMNRAEKKMDYEVLPIAETMRASLVARHTGAIEVSRIDDHGTVTDSYYIDRPDSDFILERGQRVRVMY